ncbi:MAG: sensor histidine kinase [Caulobacteraceae bacterium]|nr:sensor histidine kinase [Caulobacteraceae bacterium]
MTQTARRAAPEPEAKAPVEAPVRPAVHRKSRRQMALDDQKRSFLRMVSHELRTPLNAVIGFAEIISCELYGPLGAPQYKEYAEHIRQSGHKLLTLVNQVLEIARLEGHAVDLDLRPEPLDHALEDVLEQLKVEIRQTGLSIDIGDETALPNVLADGRGLRTILFNLLNNAITWSPQGGRISIAAAERLGMVEITIKDQGPGVDPADIPRLLRPFEQGQSALTRSTHGTGLGLPIVDALCQAMAGRLSIASVPGQGLSATVALPAA